jgi:hypothetical protein
MLSRIACASLLLGGAIASGCSDSPTAAIADTTKTNNNTTTVCTSPLTLTVGQVMPGVTGGSVCVSGGTSGAEYALIPYYGSILSAATTTVNFTAAGTSAASASPDLVPSASASFDIAGSATSFASSYPQNFAFDRTLRHRERTALTPLINGARSAMRRSSSTAHFDAIPSNPVIGQLLRLNTNSDSSCSAPDYHGGRIVAITNRAIVVADTLNPSGGYSDDEYASLGVSFDTLVDPLDRAAFGDPSDIDHNGKIVLFFTKAVNDLTPKSSSSYVGGFFDGRDLFPTASTVDFDGCAGSNVGEMFYVMVPDPSRGGPFSKTNVASEVLGTLAHEYQHLINASRRMYVNTEATDFEDVWLNEGLSHVAEELLFYRVAGLAPRANLDATAIRASSAYVNAFNNYQSSNFGRYHEFLASPTKYSPYSDNDSLETRGATWAFLRSTVDKAATSDGDFWFRLVNSTTEGMANLQNVFGPTVTTQLRDWATSVLTDDLSGVPAAYQQPSWNYRSVFAALSSGPFPISTVSLTPGNRSVSLVAGAAAYTRFAVAGGGSASVTWTTPSTLVQFTLVRTK